MSMASVRIDSGDKAAVMAILWGVKKGYEKAMTRALNLGVSKSRTESARATNKEINLPVSIIKNELSVRKASYHKLTATLYATRKPIPLISFEARQTEKGVTAKINRSGDRDLWRGAFISKVKYKGLFGVKGKHKGVFSRNYHKRGGPINPKLKYGKLPKEYRLPISQHYGPSISSVLKKRLFLIDGVEKTSGIVAQNELARQAELILRKAI